MTLRPSANQSAVEEKLQSRVSLLEEACLEAQRLYADAEHSLRTLVTYAPEAVVMMDVETGRLAEVNPAAEKLFGHSQAKLLEMSPFDLSPPNQPDGPSAELGQRVIAEAASGAVPVFEWWHLNARGERIPCEIRLVRIR